LQATCEQCSDPTFRLEAITICPFKPFKPRLAQKTDGWQQVHKILSKKGEYVAEYKLDGERLVLHYARCSTGDQVEWWSRNCKNANHIYGEAMSGVLAECIGHQVDELVLDGEMMVWNKVTQEFSAFGENRGVGDYTKRIVSGTQPCFVVFDVLWINGAGLVFVCMHLCHRLLCIRVS
jgi:DNA ligase-4